MTVPADVVELVDRDYVGSDRPAVLQLLETVEEDRVRRAVLLLAKGDLVTLEHYVEVAKVDFRDLLFWAEQPERAEQGPSFEEMQRLMRESGRPPGL